MNAPSGTQTRIEAAGQELVVVEVGGGIRQYRRDGEDILDGYGESEMCSSGRGQILAPWPNRLGDGRYEWAGQTYQTALSEPSKGNAIHGLVRWASWSVESTTDTITSRYRLYPQPGWAWTLDLQVHYEVNLNGLTVTTGITNLDGSGPCPVGLGWHPYLRAFGGVVDDVVLTLPALTAYRSDARGLPTDRYDVHGTELDFTAGRQIGPLVLDTAFTDVRRSDSGDDGRAWATIEAGERRTRLWMDGAYTHLMVFTGDTLSDPGRRRRGLALEPMTCAPDAFRRGDGLKTLEPGESFAASWGISEG